MVVSGISAGLLPHFEGLSTDLVCWWLLEEEREIWDPSREDSKVTSSSEETSASASTSTSAGSEATSEFGGGGSGMGVSALGEGEMGRIISICWMSWIFWCWFRFRFVTSLVGTVFIFNLGWIEVISIFVSVLTTEGLFLLFNYLQELLRETETAKSTF